MTWLLALGAAHMIPAAHAAEADVQVLRPATPGGPLVWTEPARTHDGLQAALVLNHAQDLLQYSVPGQDTVSIVGGVTRMDLLGGWGVGAFQFGAGVPILARIQSDVAETESGLGDLSLHARAELWDPPEGPLALGLVSRLTLPTATVDASAGAASVGLDTRVASEMEFGDVRVLANLGVRLAGDDPDLSLPAGTAMLAGLGAGWEFQDGSGLTAELAAAPILGEAELPNRVPMEALIGGWQDLSGGWRLLGGAGRHMGDGVGAPAWRVFLAVQRNTTSDAADASGDLDGDTVPDIVDICPYEPETVNGIRDADGCPEHPDVLALEKDTGDNLALASSGDRDGDGLVDSADVCPNKPEDKDGIEDTDGCPEDDVDGDGIADGADACPLAAETVNGVDDADGCPEAVSESVAKVAGVVRGITFATGSDRLESRSTKVLRQVRQVLLDNPGWSAAIEGHTDDVGAREGNLDLSTRRAAAVQKWMVSRGIDADRLSSQGFGPDKPVDTNDTEEGRAENRRVEVRYSSTKENP
jgi:outer membrane protein OmpA-like peptidoglycan-associated protein